jgi:predicted transposase YdaD
MMYHALLYAHYHVPVHTVIILLRPEAAHANLNGLIRYAPRPDRGSMSFSYEVVRLWEWPAEELLQADLGVVPLAVLCRLPENLSLQDGLTAIAQRLVERITKEAPPDRARKLLTDAYLLTGLRLRRDAAARIFRGVRAMQESDTYLAILEEGEEKGQEKATREDILLFGEGKFGPPAESIKIKLSTITDLPRLKRMVSRAVTAKSWDEILNTP